MSEQQQADPTATELSRIEEILRRPDFILEPKCMGTIIEYIKAGGAPSTCIELLGDGYVGTAHMASLVCGWLRAFADGTEEESDRLAGGGRTSMPGTAASVGSGALPPAGVLSMPSIGSPSDFAGSPSGPTVASGAGMPGGTGSRGEPLDEFSFLKDFVLSRFDADAMTMVGKAPPWVGGLIAEPRGRSLVLALSAAHRNCTLLNYAITRILEKGHEDEVARVGSSLASYFAVFHRLLSVRLTAALSACSPQPVPDSSTTSPEGPGGRSHSKGQKQEQDLDASLFGEDEDEEMQDQDEGYPQKRKREDTEQPDEEHGHKRARMALPRDAGARLKGLAAELAESCAGSEHTYVHAQLLLGLLGSHPAGGAFTRLSQELQAAATAAHPSAWSTLRLLLPAHESPPALIEAAALASRLLSSYSPPPPSRPPPHPPFPSFLPLSQRSAPAVALNAQDLLRLASCVRVAGASTVAPIIQNPALLQLIISGIFVPGKPPPADVLNAAIDILTAATTVPLAPLHDPDHATAMLQSHQGPPGPDGNTDGPHDNGWHGDSVDHGHEGGHGPQGGWGNHYHYHQNTSGLAPDSAEQAGIEEATRSALKGVLVMGSKAGGRLSEDDMTLLQQILAIPVATAALLQYARSHLGNTDYYAESAAASAGAPALIRLALLAAREQPGLAQQVVWLLGSALEAQGAGRAELAALTTGALACMLREGLCPDQVQAALAGWARGGADPSLVRHMILQVLGAVAPPYSVSFVHWLLRLMVDSGMRPVRGSTRDQGIAGTGGATGGTTQEQEPQVLLSNADLLREFAQVVTEMSAASAGSGIGPAGASGSAGGLKGAIVGSAGSPPGVDAAGAGGRLQPHALVLGGREQTLLQELLKGRS